ncbi:MAG TPA: hypothetical protein PK393_08175 [Synergistaceae bacterium]|nr:hypothetical protein [Synergistaceae bacterium]
MKEKSWVIVGLVVALALGLPSLGTATQSADSGAEGAVVAQEATPPAITADEEGFQLDFETKQIGVEIISVGSGMGIKATGVAGYGLYADVNASRISKREAYAKAFSDAKRRLLEHCNGMSLKDREKIARSAQDFISEDNTLFNRSEAHQEEINRLIEGMLSAYTVYEVADVPEEKTVYVTIITTPKIKQACSVVSGALLEAESIAAGCAQVQHEIEKGVVPPVGGRIVSVPATGEVAVISFGSEIVREFEGAKKAEEKRIAERRAKARSDAAMLRMLKGEKLIWESGLSSESEEMSKNFAVISQEDPYGNIVERKQKLNKYLESFRNDTKDSEFYQSVTEGKLPAGLEHRVWFSRDGAWCVATNVYLPSLTAQAEGTARQNVPPTPTPKLFDPGKGPSGQVQPDSSL